MRTKFKIQKTINNKTTWVGDHLIWWGGTDVHGYGRINIGNSIVRPTHRIAFELANGAIPEGMCVLHHCDIPRCINPKHLFLGTMKENTQDGIKKGRIKCDANRFGKKITTTKEIADEIRFKYAAGGISQKALGKIYGIGGPSVHRIIHRQRWK